MPTPITEETARELAEKLTLLLQVMQPKAAGKRRKRSEAVDRHKMRMAKRIKNQ